MEKILYSISIIIIIAIIAINVNATIPPFQQCVLLQTGLGVPITTGTCYFTDNATIYNYTLMSNEGSGLYCVNITNVFPIGIYDFSAECFYLNVSGYGNGTFTVDNPSSCIVNYNQTPASYCFLNDTYILEHISDNITCLPSYNTTESCNFCNANIVANTTPCNNGTQTVSYIDLNYSSCCLTTGLPSDCIISNPAYYPANQTCNYYIQDFNCTGDPTPVINPKMNINCELPDENAYCCVVNIYQGNNLTNLLATSPEYTYKGSSAVFPQDQETRTCFTPSNRLLNAYYTEKEIRPDTLYKVEVKCTSNSTTLLSQYGITPVYHTWDWFTHRVEWFGNNPIQITLTFVAIILVIIIAIYFLRKI